MKLQELAEKVSVYRNWELDRYAIREIGRVWAQFKWPIFKPFFGRSPSLVLPICLYANEDEVQRFASMFSIRYGINILEFGIEAIFSNRTPSGEKLGRYLRKKVKPEYQTDFSQAWEQFLRFVVAKGYLKITVNPFEMLAISEATTGWHSCHSVHHLNEVCYFEANLVYATDSHTILTYVYSDPTPVFAGLPAKIWRRLYYWDPENGVLIASREYPSERKLIADHVTKVLCHIFFGDEAPEIDPVISVRTPDDEDALPQFTPYLDSGYFRCYGFNASKAKLDFRSPILLTRLYENIAHAQGYVCENCGAIVSRNDIYRGLDDAIYCETCFHELFTYCDACDNLIWSSEAVVSVNDRTYCETCAERWLVVCDYCGYYVEEPDARRVVLEERSLGYLCRDCCERLAQELFECPRCHEVLIRHGVGGCANCGFSVEVKNEAPTNS